jgi:hypothetical protein
MVGASSSFLKGNTGNHGGGVFTSGRKRALEPKMGSKHFPCRRKRDVGLGKKACKSMKQDENKQNHNKGPRRSWSRNHMGNPSQNGTNGFLVSSVEECAHRIVELLKNRRLRERIGRAGKEAVRQKFLMPRFLEQHLDLFSSFESNFRHVGCCARSTWSPEHRKLFCP